MTHNIALEPWETDEDRAVLSGSPETTATLEVSYDHK